MSDKLKDLQDQIKDARDHSSVLPKPVTKAEQDKATAPGMRAGAEMIGGVLGGLMFGYFFDHSFGTAPKGVAVGLVLGIIAGFYGVWRAIKASQ